MLGWLASNWYLLLGLALVLFAAVFGIRKFKARREQDFGHTLDRLTNPAFEAAAAKREAGRNAAHADAAEQAGLLICRRGIRRSSDAAHGRRGDSAPLRAVPVTDDALSASGTAVALDQGDPLAEADFHMAYGLYDQAADLVRIAISREPQRRDLQLKLLEVFFVWGNKEQFLQLARELVCERAIRRSPASGKRSSSWAGRLRPKIRCSPVPVACTASAAPGST